MLVEVSWVPALVTLLQVLVPAPRRGLVEGQVQENPQLSRWPAAKDRAELRALHWQLPPGQVTLRQDSVHGVAPRRQQAFA